jgi:hypothetical protein
VYSLCVYSELVRLIQPFTAYIPSLISLLELYVPIRSVVSRLVVNSWRMEDREIQLKIQVNARFVSGSSYEWLISVFTVFIRFNIIIATKKSTAVVV